MVCNHCGGYGVHVGHVVLCECKLAFQWYDTMVLVLSGTAIWCGMMVWGWLGTMV